MENPHLEESDLVERYVSGRLPVEERERFEAHFVDCPECLERIEMAEGLRRGLSQVAPREPPRVVALPLIRRPRLPTMALAASIVLALAIPLALALRDAGRAKGDLQATQTAAADLRQKLEAAQSSLQREKEAHSALEAELARARQPQLTVPVFALITTRGEEMQALRLPRVPQWIVVSFEREVPPRFDRYRVTLMSSDGRQVWRGKVSPTSHEMLALGLHSSLFSPGGHVFQVEGLTKDGRPFLVARHSVRVIQDP